MKICFEIFCCFVTFSHSLNIDIDKFNLKHKSENETKGAKRKIIVDIIAQRIHRNQNKGLILKFKEDPYKESIELVKLLGQGCYGEVWKGKEKSSGREVAVKLETPTLGVSFSNEFSKV